MVLFLLFSSLARSVTCLSDLIRCEGAKQHITFLLAYHIQTQIHMAPIMVLVAPNPWIEVNDKKLLKTLRCNPALVGAQPKSGVCFCM
jgi:hypothetical protein